MIGSQVIIVGGTLNSTLKKWLNQLGIHEFNHFTLPIEDISPEALTSTSWGLYNSIPITAMIISVGPLAAKLLDKVYLLHGALPSTSTKDKKKIATSLAQCKNYLTLRRFYGQPPSGPISG
jgi:hypothetical protein